MPKRKRSQADTYIAGARYRDQHEKCTLYQVLQSLVPPTAEHWMERKRMLDAKINGPAQVRKIIEVVMSSNHAIAPDDVQQGQHAICCLLEECQEKAQVLQMLQAYLKAVKQTGSNGGVDIEGREACNICYYQDDWDIWYAFAHFASLAGGNDPAAEQELLRVMNEHALDPAYQAFATNCGKAVGPSEHSRKVHFCGEVPLYAKQTWAMGQTLARWRCSWESYDAWRTRFTMFYDYREGIVDFGCCLESSSDQPPSAASDHNACS